MAKKITLSVSESLYQKIADWRSSFNLSQMFQDMVTEAIQRKEEFQKRISEDASLSDIIRRLRMEKQEAVSKIIEKGMAEGMRWAKLAHYDELCYAISWKPEEDGNPLENRLLGSYFSECFKRENFSAFVEASGKAAGVYVDSFLSGWKMGVSGFWNMVKDKI
jgi:predicted lactoylglutathione lyase